MRDGRVDLGRLLRDAQLALARQRVQRPHVVQPVRQLHDDDADIVHHREQHLAHALGLPLLARIQLQLAQLGDAVHAGRHFWAKLFLDLFQAEAGVFDGVVQQAGDQADHVHLHVRQNHGDVQRMDHVGLARIAHLILVRIGGPPEGFFEEGEVFFGPQREDLLLQLGIELID